jgi:hypothetical protein
MFNKKVNSIDTIRDRSKAALSTFRNAINEMRMINEASSEVVIKNEIVIITMSDENKELTNVIKDNLAVIDNISALIGE